MSEEEKLTPEKMKDMIEQERQGRIEACTRELQIVMQPVLEKYRCSVIAETVHRGNETFSRMVTVAND